MKFTGLRVVCMTRADKSDPLNQLVTIGARANVDGVFCGWAASVMQDIDAPHGFEKAIEEAVSLLIAKILVKPRNPVDISGLPEPGPRAAVVDVAIGDGIVNPPIKEFRRD